MIDKQYYLIEKEGSREGFVLFWAKDAHGYTIEYEKAGTFSYEFAKDYIGEDRDSVAIEVDKFDDMARTMLVVYNHHEMLEKLNTQKENHSPFKLEETQVPKTLPKVNGIATGNLGDVSGSDTIPNYNPDYGEKTK